MEGGGRTNGAVSRLMGRWLSEPCGLVRTDGAADVRTKRAECVRYNGEAVSGLMRRIVSWRASILEVTPNYEMEVKLTTSKMVVKIDDRQNCLAESLLVLECFQVLANCHCHNSLPSMKDLVM